MNEVQLSANLKDAEKAFNEFNEIYGRCDNIKEHKKYLNVI